MSRSKTLTMRLFRHLLRIILFVLVIEAFIAASAVASTSFTASSSKPLLCINALQPFGFGLSSGQRGSAVYQSNPFRNGGSDIDVMPDARLMKIRSAGFDCVRMAVDVATLMAAPDDAALDRLVKELTAGIARRVRLGLKVIADIHPFPQGVHPVPGYADVDLVDGPDGPKFSRLLEVVSRFANAIGPQFGPSDVAVELFNEPPSPKVFSGRPSWNRQIEAYWMQIRRVLPNHTLIVAGMGFAEIDGTISGYPESGLTNLRPENFDGNTGFAFHPYESGLFTHQGDPGFFSHVHGLSFPADSHYGGQRKAEDDYVRAVVADNKLTFVQKMKQINDFVIRREHSYSFSRYWKEFGSQEALAARLTVLIAWADAHGLDRRQIMNTEFGVNRNQPSCEKLAPIESAAAFIKATLENSKKAGIGTVTIHEIQGSCFAISDSAAPFEFDPTILSSLGLR